MSRRNRSRAREVALQLLFQVDLNPGIDSPDIARFVHDRLGNSELESFAMSLYDGVRGRKDRIDLLLGQAARNWRVARMATADRNVLRLGAYELLHDPTTPAGVVINEAIELARRFGSAESPAFVNGVLDRINKENVTPSPEIDPSRAQD